MRDRLVGLPKYIFHMRYVIVYSILLHNTRVLLSSESMLEHTSCLAWQHEFFKWIIFLESIPPNEHEIIKEFCRNKIRRIPGFLVYNVTVASLDQSSAAGA